MAAEQRRGRRGRRWRSGAGAGGSVGGGAGGFSLLYPFSSTTHRPPVLRVELCRPPCVCSYDVSRNRCRYAGGAAAAKAAEQRGRRSSVGASGGGAGAAGAAMQRSSRCSSCGRACMPLRFFQGTVFLFRVVCALCAWSCVLSSVSAMRSLEHLGGKVRLYR